MHQLLGLTVRCPELSYRGEIALRPAAPRQPLPLEVIDANRCAHDLCLRLGFVETHREGVEIHLRQSVRWRRSDSSRTNRAGSFRSPPSASSAIP